MVDVATLTIAVDSRQLGTATTAQDRFTQSGQRAERQSQRFSRSQTQAGAASRRFGNQIQNASFQVGDFFVQIASGQDATRALAQQLPQLLGGFGVLGAVAGAAAAGAGALIPVLLDNRDAASAFEEQLDDLSDALGEFRDAASASDVTLRDLGDRFGRFANDARVVLRRITQEEFRQLREEITETARLIADQNIIGEQPIRNLADAFDLDIPFLAFTDATRQAREEVNRLVGDALNGFRRLNEATTLEEQLAAATSLAESYRIAAEASGEITDEEQQVLNTLDQLIVSIQEAIASQEAFVDVTQEAGVFADALSSTIAGIDFSNAISGANTLIARISQAAQSAAAVVSAVGSAVSRGVTEQQRLDVQNLELELRRGGASAAEIGGATAGLRERQRLENQIASGVLIPDAVIEQLVQNAEDRGAEFAANQAAIADLRRTSRGGGGSGAQRELNRLRREGIQLTESLRTAEEEFADELERVNQLFEAGIISQQTFDRATQELTNTYDQFGFTINDVRDSLADTFTDIITGSENARDAIGNLAAEFGRLLLNDTFRRIISGQGFGGGGGLGGLLGSILPFANGGVFQGGNVTAFANGGVVSSPTFFPMQSGTGLMGEAGPEAIVPLRRGTGGRLGVDAQQVQVSLVVTAEEGELFRPVIRAESTQAAVQVSQVTTQAQRANLPSSIQEIQNRGTAG